MKAADGNADAPGAGAAAAGPAWGCGHRRMRPGGGAGTGGPDWPRVPRRALPAPCRTCCPPVRAAAPGHRTPPAPHPKTGDERPVQASGLPGETRVWAAVHYFAAFHWGVNDSWNLFSLSCNVFWVSLFLFC